MEGKKVSLNIMTDLWGRTILNNVRIPLLKVDTLSRNGCIIPKDVLEKALEEWKQKGMPSVEIRHNN